MKLYNPIENSSHFPHVFFRRFLPLVWKKPKLYIPPKFGGMYSLVSSLSPD